MVQHFEEKLATAPKGKVYLPNHGNSNWPRGIADRQTEISIVRSLVLTLLHMVYDLCQTVQHVIREGLMFTAVLEHGREEQNSEVRKTHPRSYQLEEGLEVLCGLYLRRSGQHSLARSLHVL